MVKPVDNTYLMEGPEEIFRLEIKTDLEAVTKQARWCGIRKGQRVLDVGCGTGKISSILLDMAQPDGEVVGIDSSEDRIRYARKNYGKKPGIEFIVHDLRYPLPKMDPFDIIWVRLFLEYFRNESRIIVSNLTDCLKPGGTLCLMDLDHNCLSHYEIPKNLEKVMWAMFNNLENSFDFDPYAGRKLYSYIYDLEYEDIKMDLMAHHLIFGKLKPKDVYNWEKKAEIATSKISEIFEEYPGGRAGFLDDFRRFLLDPRRFTYTPLIMCKGRKPD